MNTITTLTIMLFSVGAVQGLVFGSILLRSNEQNELANKLLAAILLLLSYRLIVQILRLFGLGYYDAWYYVMLDLSWVHGALLYFYVKSLLFPSFKIKGKDWFHFLPLIIQIGFSVFVRLQNLYWDGTRESLSWLGYWGYVVWMNYSTIYIIASILIVLYANQANKLLKQSDPEVQISPQRALWISKIIKSFKFYFILVLLVLLIDILVYNVTLGNNYHYFTRYYYYPFFIGISFLTYWLGMEGFKRKDEIGLTINQPLSKQKTKQLNDIAGRLEALVLNEQIYKDPELSLQKVADELHVKPYLLSNALKTVLNLKFNDYINAYRVEEVQRMLKENIHARRTLLDLAMAAGFNSKSSFNRAIRKKLGISPRELKR